MTSQMSNDCRCKMIRGLRDGRAVVRSVRCFVIAMAAVLTAANTESAVAQNSRRFELDYQLTVEGLDDGQRVRVWMPVPPSDAYQSVQVRDRNLPPHSRRTREPRYGNQMLYFETEASSDTPLTASVQYDVLRREIRSVRQTSAQPLSDAQRKLFLQAQRKVPLTGPHIDLLAREDLPSDPFETAKRLYDLVDERVQYDKSRSGYGHGDAVWVCDSRFGNCTDFHSLFIAWARSHGIPAKFEIGFPLPPKRGTGIIGGYHCWGFFHTQTSGWVPVDISEADRHPELKKYYFGNLTADRVTFSTGRDIDLVPRQTGPALNYFVYPHVEVAGRPVGREQLQLTFRFRDQPASPQ